METRRTDLTNEIDAVGAFATANPSTAAGQIAELEQFLVLVASGNASMTAARTAALSLISSLEAASTSPSPYGGQSDKLGDNLLVAQSKSVQILRQVDELALKGIRRYTDQIDFDIRLQITNINNALSGVLNAAITEARDELIEAGPDAQSQLTETRKNVNELLTDVALRISDIQTDLNAISSPNPAFSTVINNFLAA